MKATELMVGDWIIADYMIGKQVKAKVGWLSPQYREGVHDQIGFIPVPMIDNLEQYVNDECSIHAIPLTEEILKVNGFVYDDGGRHSLCYCTIPNEQMTITISEYGSKDKRGHYECHKVIIDRNGVVYVHELQHALRLCGLNELADNFKVEV